MQSKKNDAQSKNHLYLTFSGNTEGKETTWAECSLKTGGVPHSSLYLCHPAWSLEWSRQSTISERINKLLRMWACSTCGEAKLLTYPTHSGWYLAVITKKIPIPGGWS